MHFLCGDYMNDSFGDSQNLRACIEPESGCIEMALGTVPTTWGACQMRAYTSFVIRISPECSEAYIV